MQWTKPIRKLLAAALVVVTVAFGITAATHDHHRSEQRDECATCRVVHSSATAPALSSSGPVLVLHSELLPLPSPGQAALADVEAPRPRGPPSLAS